MSSITEPLISILGQIMKFCYFVVHNYGFSIILFTLITKVILFPLALLVQKNAIKMVNLMPEENALKIKYVDDKDKFTDEQLALYKRHHYHPMLGVVPLLFQIPLVLGLVGVIYRPLAYGVGLSSGIINKLKDWFISVNPGIELKSTFQLDIMNAVKSGADIGDSALQDAVKSIMNFNTTFAGIDLSKTPSFDGDLILWLIPVLSGLSALTLCLVQNKVNVLQLTQNKAYKAATTIFMIAFSSYFACIVPAGVGLYWIFGNLFAIPSMLLVNLIIPPKKHIDYDYFMRMKAEKAKSDELHRKNSSREKADYKRFTAFENKKLVVYSEASGFYKYMGGIVEFVNNNSSYDIHYVTSDPNDSIFKKDDLKIHKYYIASDRYLIPLFMKLDCDICLMTTPDLEKYHIKRSRVRKDIEYIYTDHGIGSPNLTFRKGAFNYFDTIFSTGPDCEAEIRAIEDLYGTPKKRILELGYPLIDDMIAQYEASEHTKNDKPLILIGPSWQPDNIIDVCIEDMLDCLRDKPYNIIVRPHPQQVRHTPERFEELKEKYADYKNIEITTDFSSNNPVLNADLVITDWSNLAFEYSFVVKRPSLYIDTPMKIMNPEYQKIDLVPRNIKLRNVVGRSVPLEDIKNIDKYIDDLLSKTEEYSDICDKALYEYVFNVGKSSKLGGKYIIRQLEGKYGKSN